jgi:demethylmenaquinone methyltransferase/2-methoxy-6-polyprenyl-1,4-benzoquinol methylase
MIPFNHLGWLFSRFGNAAYPEAVVHDLCDALNEVRRGGSVLDLGAGTGIVGNYAHGCRSDLRFVAADPAEGMLKYVPKHVEKVTARAEALPFEADVFDAVVAGEALHHFDDPGDALAEIARVLRGGGVIFVYEFDPSTFLGRLICLAEKLLGEPGHFYPPDILAGKLEAHGFGVRIGRHGWRYTLTAHLKE